MSTKKGGRGNSGSLHRTLQCNIELGSLFVIRHSAAYRARGDPCLCIFVNPDSPGAAETFRKIRKRDGEIVPFDAPKIRAAIAKAGKATGEFGEHDAKWLRARVLEQAHKSGLGPIPEVKKIQDIVERVLFEAHFYKTGKAYIIYRDQHAWT